MNLMLCLTIHLKMGAENSCRNKQILFTGFYPPSQVKNNVRFSILTGDDYQNQITFLKFSRFFSFFVQFWAKRIVDLTNHKTYISPLVSSLIAFSRLSLFSLVPTGILECYKGVYKCLGMLNLDFEPNRMGYINLSVQKILPTSISFSSKPAV